MNRDRLVLFACAFLIPFSLVGCGGSPPEDVAEPAGPPPEMSPAPPTFDEYGYQARACGFDLDDDGVVGEPEDDCNVCDGVTTDPDGDGVEEDLVYVACGSGSDAFGCGTPESPCGSIEYAWKNVIDGPDNGAEDIVCFRGRCAEENLGPAVGGLDTVWTAPAEGSAGRDWEMSKDPSMLVGWDLDDDGEYPPHDKDDLAVLDGTEGGTRAFMLGSDQDHLELAHFTVKDYGRFTQREDAGLVRFEEDGTSLSHIAFHDLELLAINMDRPARRALSVIHLTTNTLRLHWLRFENLLVRDNGGAFALGAGPGEEPALGPFRFRNISRTAHVCDFNTCDQAANTMDIAFSGYLSGFEVLDSAWFANVAHWRPKDAGGPSGAVFVTAGRYTQDWLIRNNLVIDHKNGLIVRGAAAADYTGTTPRPVDQVVFDRNFFLNTYAEWKYGDAGVDLRGGEEPEELVGTVHITNNVLASTSAWDACLWMKVGNEYRDPPGEIHFLGNTCYGEVDRYGAVVVGNPEGKDYVRRQQKVVFSGNIVSGVGVGNANILATYGPSEWQADGNIYDPEGFYRWRAHSVVDLGEFQGASEADAGSKSCTPAFRQAGRNFHLKPADTCARDAGVELPGVTVDLDGEPRGEDGAWDVGADEVAPAPEAASDG